MAAKKRTQPRASTNKDRGKTTSTLQEDASDQDDLAVSEEEMYRIIRETGVLGASFASATEPVNKRGPTKPASVTVSDEDLHDDVTGPRIIELDDEDSDVDDDGATGVTASTTSAPRKLVELIDGDESQADPPAATPFDLLGPLAEDDSFRFLLWMIVFATLWLSLDVAIHAQYAQNRSIKDELGRAVNVLPGLAFAMYFTWKYSSNILSRMFLFAWSVVGGSYMVHIVNHESYLKVMRRCPILGTLWVWAIVQLDLPSALLSLAGVAGYIQYADLRVIFPA